MADPSQPSGAAIHTQAIAFTAGFHFAFIEQGGTSLYPSLAQRVRDDEVLRVLLSIGPTESMHFQTWHDKAGNATQITDTDTGFPGSTGATVTFPNLNSGTDPNDPGQTSPSPTAADQSQTNLIMPEPTFFLDRSLGRVSIIRPTETKGAAMGAFRASSTTACSLATPRAAPSRTASLSCCTISQRMPTTRLAEAVIA